MKSHPETHSKIGNPQPLQAAQLNDALLTIRTVMAATGLSRSAVYARMSVGAFPKPIKLSARCVRWTSLSIQDWIKALAASAT